VMSLKFIECNYDEKHSFHLILTMKTLTTRDREIRMFNQRAKSTSNAISLNYSYKHTQTSNYIMQVFLLNSLKVEMNKRKLMHIQSINLFARTKTL